MRFQIDYFADCSMASGVSWGIRENDDRNPEHIVSLLVRCIPRDLFDALDVPVAPRPCHRLGLSDLSRIARDEFAD